MLFRIVQHQHSYQYVLQSQQLATDMYHHREITDHAKCGTEQQLLCNPANVSAPLFGENFITEFLAEQTAIKSLPQHYLESDRNLFLSTVYFGVRYVFSCNILIFMSTTTNISQSLGYAIQQGLTGVGDIPSLILGVILVK